jgi:hypothetical protein
MNFNHDKSNFIGGDWIFDSIIWGLISVGANVTTGTATSDPPLWVLVSICATSLDMCESKIFVSLSRSAISVVFQYQVTSSRIIRKIKTSMGILKYLLSNRLPEEVVYSQMDS